MEGHTGLEFVSRLKPSPGPVLQRDTKGKAQCTTRCLTVWDCKAENRLVGGVLSSIVASAILLEICVRVC